MKKYSKIFSLTLCTALALSTLPVNGSLTKPTVALAAAVAATAWDGAELAGEVSHAGDATGKAQVTLSGTSSAGISGTHKYAWGTKEAQPETIDTVISGTTIDITDVTKTRLYFKENNAETVKYLDFTQGEAVPATLTASEDKQKIVGASADFQWKEKSETNWTDFTGAEYNPNLSSGTKKTYVVRRKGNTTVFPSAESADIVLVNKAALVKDDLAAIKTKLDENNKLVIEKESYNGLYADGTKTGKIFYKNGTSEFTELPEQLENDLKLDLSGKDVTVIFCLEADKETDGNQYKIKVTKEATPEGITKTGALELTGFDGKGYHYRLQGTKDFSPQNENVLTLREYGVYEIIKKASSDNSSFTNFGSQNKTYKVDSEALLINLSNPLALLALEEEMKKEEAKTEEPKKDETKTEEPKKDETKTEEPKKDETKTEEPKTEEPASEEPVDKTVSSKKASATVSAEDVALVTGKLTVKVKGATVALPKDLLSEGAVKVSLKAMAPKKDSKDAKALTKNLKKNKLVDKKVYSLSVKTGMKNVKGKFVVTLKTSLKKAPKKLYVMNITNGKLMKAKFKKGMITFTAGMTGKFVVVTK